MSARSTSLGSSRPRIGLLGLLLTGPMIASPSWGSGAAEADIAAAASLVAARYFEGLPFDQASQIGAPGSDYLAQVLADPSAAEQHANVVLALGMAGQRGAYEALAGYARSNPVPATHGARRVFRLLTQAMGHLARRDARALAWLRSEEIRATRSGDLPRRDLIWTSIGMAGTQAAEAALAEIATTARADEREARVLARARTLCNRVSNEGAHSVFADRAAGR